MRSVGSAQHARGLGVQDHLSWPYEQRGDFVRRVREFLGDGLALGLRCVYLADGPREQLEADMVGIPDLDSALERGALTLTVLDDLYPAGGLVDPAETLATYAAATEEALAQGYAGLRVAADSTPLVRTPEQLDAFAEWEHEADRFMTDHPLSALCGFDREQLPAAATVALACMHPAARQGMTPFHVYSPGNGADLGLAGELDVLVADDFSACLGRTGLDVTQELVVDGSDLDFIDYRALAGIRDFADRLQVPAVLRTHSTTPARLIELLGLEGIRTESPTAEGVRA